MFDRPNPRQAKALIESQGLRFEPEFDELVGAFEEGSLTSSLVGVQEGRLIACGARAGYILKMLAIDPSYQGSDVLGGLVTQLLQSAFLAGHDTLFIFTKPQNVASFTALNFHLLVTHGQAALLEYGPGLEAYIASHAKEITPGRNGAVVINGNPFTLGHLHLVECAASRVDRLYLFVVREERSAFPFAVRFRLAHEATAHLGNVTVLDTSRYAVSAATFPSYFLKRLDEAASAQMHIDLLLFAERIAPRFHVVTRFVGQEPLCPVTAAYNRLMAEVLKTSGIECVELPRLAHGVGPISATRVRQAFAQGDFETLKPLVPPPTLAFLESPAAQAIAERLRKEIKEA